MNEDGSVVVPGEDVPGWAVRLEAKLDVALAQHGARLVRTEDRVADVHNRLKRIEDDPRISAEAFQDHENRIRIQESSHYVTGRNLVAALLTTLSIAVAVLTILDRINL